ncbi:hypothetical protein [Rhodococcus opacus]|uniref:hypothetical protein n=1 Tax=Rhodococcus opacus TaxID=37919 RepID=UPI0022363788|nr:hypothetical protein [Rhodococcus opacus]UZG58026.1 hypothetical protein ONE62_12270 [Rhodococcus opacus]
MAEEQGKEYAGFIQKELEREYGRRDTVNSRAATAITSATGLVTIVLAVVAVAKGKDFTLSGCALVSLWVALLSFLASAILAVLAGINWKYKATSVESMYRMVGDRWEDDTEVTARNLAALCNVVTIKSLRGGTTIKYRLLLGSAGFQALAIAALAASVIALVT